MVYVIKNPCILGQLPRYPVEKSSRFRIGPVRGSLFSLSAFACSVIRSVFVVFSSPSLPSGRCFLSVLRKPSVSCRSFSNGRVQVPSQSMALDARSIPNVSYPGVATRTSGALIRFQSGLNRFQSFFARLAPRRLSPDLFLIALRCLTLGARDAIRTAFVALGAGALTACRPEISFHDAEIIL